MTSVEATDERFASAGGGGGYVPPSRRGGGFKSRAGDGDFEAFAASAEKAKQEKLEAEAAGDEKAPPRARAPRGDWERTATNAPQAKKATAAQTVCAFFAARGFCKNGDDCRFSHAEVRGPAGRCLPSEAI
jgi:hypothetical protein